MLRGIKAEQSAFRADVDKTKKSLQNTWDKKRNARIETSAASKKMTELRKKMEPLRKKVATAVAIKDLATSKVKAVGSGIKKVGKMVAKPVVKIAVTGAKALKSVGSGIAKAAKVAAIGTAAVAAAGTAGLAAVFGGSTDAAKAQIEAETKLEQVLTNVKSVQARGAGAAAKAKEELMGVAGSLQQIGVIGDEVTLAGMQQLATFQLSDKEITKLSGGMTDLLAQQKGLNATQEDAVNVANMVGKAMQGQMGALSRVGITFSESQKKAMETANATGRAAILADILQQNVGGVNQALAQTDQGKIQQMTNAWGDMREEVGKVALQIKAKFASSIAKHIPTIQRIGTTLMDVIGRVADKALPVIDKVLTKIGPIVSGSLGKIGRLTGGISKLLSGVFSGGIKGFDIKGLLAGFAPLLPQLKQLGGQVVQSMQQVASSVLPVIGQIVGTIQRVLPSVLPVIQTVVRVVGDVLAKAAPVIGGLVDTIGTVVSALAPVFNTIFKDIGAVVGRALDFVGSKMGWISDTISEVAPLIADIFETAWGVIGPVLDLAMSVFEALYNVFQAVFPAIQGTLEVVWAVIGPIIEGIGNLVGWIADGIGGIADWIGGMFGGGNDAEVGHNARGTDNWRGGVTWVGEQGPELVNLPAGSKVLPHSASMDAVRPVVSARVQQQVVAATGMDYTPVLSSIVGYLGAIAALQSRQTELSAQGISILQPLLALQPSADGGRTQQTITVNISHLADTIVIRKDADIDKIGEEVAQKVIDALKNLKPS